MSQAQVVASIGAALDDLGGRWMGGPLISVGAELGLEPYPWPFYMAGRGGVLGDVDADVVTAAMAFMRPELVREAWQSGGDLLPRPEAVDRFIGCAHDWARNAFAAVPSLDRFNDLSGRMVAAFSPVGVPLAAGWRAVPLPDDPAAKAIQLVHVLRELRGGLHIAAVLAHGVSLVDAVMATEGEMVAGMYGWDPPYPDVEAARAAKAPAENTTNEMAARTFAVLDQAEMDEFAHLAQTVNTLSSGGK